MLIDFWADWCGPCKQLSPVLERLAAEADGAWVLAKVDVDRNQAIAGQLQIQSIPTVLLALGGRLVQGFTGALPERELRSFLEQVLAAAAQAGLPGAGAAADDGEAAPAAPADPELVAAEDAVADGDYAARGRGVRRACSRAGPATPRPWPARAWAQLLERSADADPDAVLAAAAAAPDDVAAQTAAADVEILSDRIDDAIARLVELRAAQLAATTATPPAATCCRCSTRSTPTTRASSPAAGRCRTRCSSRAQSTSAA